MNTSKMIILRQYCTLTLEAVLDKYAANQLANMTSGVHPTITKRSMQKQH